MTKTTTTVLMLMTALLLADSTPATAQAAFGPDKFVSVTVGAQPQQRTVEANATASIFDEDAVFTADHSISNGPFFDFAGGYRVTPDFTLGLGFSFFTSKGSAEGTASIPDPLFVGRPTVIGIQGNDLKRTELAFHIQGVWFLPVTNKIDVAIAVGPSIVRVSQDFLSGALEEATQTVAIGPGPESGTGFGFNVGADTTYMFTSQYGVGLLLRYTWASVGLPAADVTTGGFQVGAGLRARF